MGYISADELEVIAGSMGNNAYGEYLVEILKETRQT
jgi:hypothetical protein